jgi:hypothetical protein
VAGICLSVNTDSIAIRLTYRALRACSIIACPSTWAVTITGSAVVNIGLGVYTLAIAARSSTWAVIIAGSAVVNISRGIYADSIAILLACWAVYWCKYAAGHWITCIYGAGVEVITGYKWMHATGS